MSSQSIHDSGFEHFESASREWSARYATRPARISDHDLQTRRRIATALVDAHAAQMSAEPRVLDVGCGSGDFLYGLREQRLQLHGADLSPGMVQAAQQQVADADLRVADAAKLPWPDASMDIVTSLGVIEYVPNLQRVVREFHRVLRPGGVLIASFPNRASVLRKLSQWETRAEAIALRLRDRLRRRKRDAATAPPYVHTDFTPGRAEQLLEDGGFSVLERRCHTYGFWGRLGRLPGAVRLSERLSRTMRTPTLPARYLASTLLYVVKKPDDTPARTSA